MKKLLAILLIALLAAGAVGCSCNEVEEGSLPSVPSVVSITTPSLPSVPVNSAIGDDFVGHTFEVDAVSTSDFNSYKKMSDAVAVRFSPWMPPTWVEADGNVFNNADGKPVCEVLAPVYLSDGQKLPDVPGEKVTGGAEIVTTSDVYLSAMRGKLVTRGTDSEKIYEYYMTDANIVYRVTFRSYGDSATDRDIYNAVMDKLVNGK